MNKGFWDKLRSPFFVLAPMADVTDFAFRKIIAKYSKHARRSFNEGGPDVFWTEFVSADGLCSLGKENLLPMLKYDESMRPIVAQIFGSNPQKMCEAAILIKKLGFDGLDINMGCPDRAILKQGAGGALIKNPALAKELILAAREGAKGLPVSVKTRIGVSRPMLEEWFGFLANQNLAAITVHLRTVKELSEVPAHWDLMPEIVKLVKNVEGAPPHILGNGDVMSLREAEEKCTQTGADGVMLGRAIFGNPWLFNPRVKFAEITLEQKIKVMLEHTKLFEKTFKGKKNFDLMKKHYKAYINNFPGAKELRNELMQTKTAKQVADIVKKFEARLVRRSFSEVGSTKF